MMTSSASAIVSNGGGDGELKLPPGFRFHPTDEELVLHYLCPKCASQSISVPIIAEIDLYKFDPWLLPGMAKYGEKEWYFFSPRDRKYPKGSRPNRAAGTGYWKATGVDKAIGKPRTLAIKKALVFYAGRPPKGIKTNWIMHEYRLANVDRSAAKRTNLRLDDWVLCRIYKKKGIIEKGYNNIDESPMLQYSDLEEHKPMITPHATTTTTTTTTTNVGLSTPLKKSQSHVDTSDSSPHCHTDTSGSSHVISPEFMCDREVQSEPKWNELEMAFDLPFNFIQPFPEDDPFGPTGQYQFEQMANFQDLMMFLR